MAKIYVCGPMTGLPDYNYPAFNEAAEVLQAHEHVVLNPARNPEPPCKSWEGYMRMALGQLVQCDTLVLLPGWAESRGAMLEYKLARILALKVGHYKVGAVGGFEPMEETPPMVGERATDWAAA